MTYHPGVALLPRVAAPAAGTDLYFSADRSAPSPLRIRSTGRTDPGLCRPRNEDSFTFDDRQGVYLLADGIGGGPHGEVASRLAVDTVLQSVRRQSTVAPAPERLRIAISQAQERICEAVHDNPELIGMGTTMVALLLEDHDRAVIAHVGDSRAYRLRDGHLDRLTRDHTMAAELIARGQLDEADARCHPLNHVLTRALCPEVQSAIDTTILPVAPGDLFLLCSDGLSDMLGHDEIRACLRRGGSGEEICDRLIRRALECGGHDNVTVLLVEVLDRPE